MKRNHSKNHIRKILAVMFAVMFAIGSIGINTVGVQADTPITTTKKGLQYKVTSEAKMTAQFVKMTGKGTENVVIADTVKINNKTYKVTSVAANALKGNTKVTELIIGCNVTKIGKKAFYNCKNLDYVKIMTTELTKNSIGADAFAKLDWCALVDVPYESYEKLAEYRAVLKSKGFSGKKRMVSAFNRFNNFDPSVSYIKTDICYLQAAHGKSKSHRYYVYDPEENRTSTSIGNPKKNRKTSEYSAGDTVTLHSRIQLAPAIYGHWEEDSRRITKGWGKCNECGKYFPSPNMLGMHGIMELTGMEFCGVSSYCFGQVCDPPRRTWAFIPDPAPCRTTLRYMLPQGLSYENGSVEVLNCNTKENLTNSCTITTSGNDVIITIEDIKSDPFFLPFDYESYKKDLCYNGRDSEKLSEGFNYSIQVVFNAKVNSNAGADNVVTAEMSYSYKGSEQAETYTLSIHTASLQVGCTDAEGNSLSGAVFDLYQTKAKPSGGMSDYVLFASGIHAGDVITGLGTGERAFENEYKVVQTKAPDGYKAALPVEFALSINTDGTITVSAEDEHGNALPVKDRTVQVNVVNAPSKVNANSVNAAPVQNTVPVQTAAQNTQENAAESKPAANTSSSSGKKLVFVNAVYYRDGIREYSMRRQQAVPQSETMMDGRNIYKMTRDFSGCSLQKITLNGVEIDAVPSKVEDGSEVCFYYVTDSQ